MAFSIAWLAPSSPSPSLHRDAADCLADGGHNHAAALRLQLAVELTGNPPLSQHGANGQCSGFSRVGSRTLRQAPRGIAAPRTHAGAGGCAADDTTDLHRALCLQSGRAVAVVMEPRLPSRAPMMVEEKRSYGSY